MAGNPALAQTPSSPEIKILRFDFVETRGRLGHEGLFAVSGQPVTGTIQQLIVKLLGPFDTVSFAFVSTTGVPLQTLDLDPLGDPVTNRGEYIGLVPLPDQPFQVSASGLDKDGNPYTAIFSKVFGGQTVEVNFDRTPFRLDVGTTQLSAAVTNHGLEDTFALLISSNLRLITRVEPSSLTLTQGATGTFIADVTVPLDMPENTNVKVTAKVSAVNDPTIENSAVFILPTVELPRILPPPDVTVPAQGPLTPVNIGTAQATKGLVPENNAPDLFPQGTSIVTWKVMDVSGNVAKADQTIIVGDGGPGDPGDPSDPSDTLEIKLKDGTIRVKASKGKFRLDGKLKVKKASDGISLSNEEVTITFGPFSETLPAGSFKSNRKGRKWTYNSKRARGLTRVKIVKIKNKDSGKDKDKDKDKDRDKDVDVGDGWTLKVVAKRIDTTGFDLSVPVPFKLGIGNDSGETDFLFRNSN